MAWVEKYYIEHISNGGVQYRVSIKKEDFVGSARRLYLLGNGALDIDYKHEGWFKPIIGQSCSITVLNDSDNWYDLEDLATLDEKEFLITVDATLGSEHITLFEGHIQSDVVTQKYLKNSYIQFTASNLVSKLSNVYPSIIDTPGKESIINVINHTLQLTGKTDEIYVNNKLDPSGITITNNRSCFNVCGVDTEAFWENNIEKTPGLNILNEILTTFDSYLYWYDKKWYIQRYADIWTSDSSKHWINYHPDVSYVYNTDASSISIPESSINLPISDFTNAAFTGRTQQVSMIPGLKYLEIEMKNEPYLNLTTNTFKGITGADLVPEVMYPSVRKWNAYRAENPFDGKGWNFPGYGYGGLFGNASQGYLLNEQGTFFQGTQYPGMQYQNITSAIYRSGVPQYYHTTTGAYQYTDIDRASLCTRFKMTIGDEKAYDPSIGKSTMLNLKWKYGIVAPGSGGPQAWDYKCNYFLRVPPGNRFIHYNDSKQYWEYKTTFKDASNYVVVNGADVGKNGVAEINIDVPIGDVSGWTLANGDYEVIFGILGEKTRKTGTVPWPANYFNPWAWYGDVQISANSGLQNNRVLAEINSKALTKEVVKMSLFDIKNLNYRNGIFYDSGYEKRTDYWQDKDMTDYHTLAEWLIHDRFQLYNRNRRKIEGTLRYVGFLKPFSMWVDTYDPCTRKYILTDYTYSPGEDSYKCSWLEYDNSETVNLNIV